MSKAKIMVVEDNRIVAEDIKNNLVQMGYAISAVATSGERALKAAGSEVPDIVIMDIRLGRGMNGIETATKLRKDHHIPIIYLTAHADEATISNAKLTQPYAYLVKPFDVEELQSAVEIALYKHQIERQVLESRQWLETTLNSIGDGVIATDWKGNVKFVNPVAAKMTGWPQAEAIGKPLNKIFRIVNERTRLPCEDPVAKVIERGQIIGLANHTVLINRYGQEIPIKDSGAPIQLADDNPLGVVLVFQDDTKSRAAEMALRENEAKLRLAMESADEGVWEWDLATSEVHLDDVTFEMLGFEPQKSADHRAWWWSRLHPDDRKKLQSSIQALADGQMDDLAEDYRLRNSDGEDIWFSSRASKVKYEQDDASSNIIGIQRNINKRKQMEVAVTKAKDMAEQYLNIAPSLIVSVDLDGKVTLLNDEGCTILNCRRQDAIGKIWFDTFLPDNARKEVIRVFDNLIHGQIEGLEVVEGIVKTSTNELRNVLWNNSLLYDSKGKIRGLLSSGLDITDRKRAELEKQNLEAQLRQSQKMEAIGTLAGGIAHDFNNILASIIGFTELAMDDTDSGTLLHENLNEIMVAGMRARDLVKQILLFSRHSEFELKPVRLNTLVKESLKLLRSTLPVSIDMMTSISEETITIISNPTQIHQIIVNLCTNSYHALPEEGGWLRIELETACIQQTVKLRYADLLPGLYAKITIQDNGSGIPQADLDKIFDPYYTTKPQGKGTGLGLSIVMGIVNAHKGRISVDSVSGKGSSFCIYLPLAEHLSREQPSSAENELPVGSERILFVDDEATIVKVHRLNLERLGYSVQTRTSGTDALEIVKTDPDQFDLVITDMTMPQMTGDKLAREIKRIRADIPIVLCSGYSEKLAATKGLPEGVDGFLMKPIQKEKLAHYVRSVLDAKKD